MIEAKRVFSVVGKRDMTEAKWVYRFFCSVTWLRSELRVFGRKLPKGIANCCSAIDGRIVTLRVPVRDRLVRLVSMGEVKTQMRVGEVKMQMRV